MGGRMSKCKICRQEFIKRSMTHKTCGPDCAEKYGIEQARKNSEKKKRQEAQEDRLKRESLKTKSAYIKEAQKAFNAYIRYRDKDKPCICCGMPLGAQSIGGLFDCGHYRSVGSAPHLRFHEQNAHGQRKQCNRWGAGRAVDYRLGLIERIGLSAVEALESDKGPRLYTAEDLKSIKAHYANKLKKLKRICN